MTDQAPFEKAEDRARAREDLDFLRSVIDEGRKVMLRGGGFLALWGCVLALGFAGAYGIEAYDLPVGGWYWGAVIALGWLGTWLLRKRLSRSERHYSRDNRLFALVSQASGIVILCYYFPAAFAGTFEGLTITVLTTAMFGTNFFIAAFLSGLTLLRYVAYGWWAALIWLAIQPDYTLHMLLVMALLLLLLLAAPGFWLMRIARNEADHG